MLGLLLGVFHRTPHHAHSLPLSPLFSTHSLTSTPHTLPTSFFLFHTPPPPPTSHFPQSPLHLHITTHFSHLLPQSLTLLHPFSFSQLHTTKHSLHYTSLTLLHPRRKVDTKMKLFFFVNIDCHVMWEGLRIMSVCSWLAAR